MKLVKFLKHIDFCTDIEVYNEKDKLIYSGSVIPFHAIADKDSRYLEECEEDEDYVAIKEYKQALLLKNRKLFTDINSEAVGIKRLENNHGVEKFVLTIYVRDEK